MKELARAQETGTEASPGTGSGSWDIVLQDNRDYVYRLACHLSGNMHEAEDITQETLMKAFEHRAGFRGEASVRTWLSRIAVNTYLASRRKDGRVTAVGTRLEGARDFLDSPEYLVVRGEFLQCIHYLLQYYCRPSDRAILVMRDINGLKYQDISEVLGITLAAVKTRLHRARRAFRDLLIREGCVALVNGGRCVCEGVRDL
jgi:RNA polymerase sigma-70 factor (ECF subfamily)